MARILIVEDNEMNRDMLSRRLERKGFSVKNAKLFVTLEPCSHVKKKTPPCSHLIVEKGIKEVFIGMKDPNKKVNGKGIRFLKKYNIKTTVLDYKIENLNSILKKVMMAWRCP